MVSAKFVCNWLRFFDCIAHPITIPMSIPELTSAESDDQSIILRRVASPSCEMYSSIICYYFLSHSIEYLNSQNSDTENYRIHVQSPAKDRRNDKKSDYTIYRVVNERTVAVIEVKLGVSSSITAMDKDYLAQLFYETHLVHVTENRKYKKRLAVYASHNSWHLFLLQHIGCLGLVVKNYSIIPSLSIKSVLNGLVHFIAQLS